MKIISCNCFTERLYTDDELDINEDREESYTIYRNLIRTDIRGFRESSVREIMKEINYCPYCGKKIELSEVK